MNLKCNIDFKGEGKNSKCLKVAFEMLMIDKAIG
jgi:hypothetical protein